MKRKGKKKNLPLTCDSFWEAHLIGSCNKKCTYCKKTSKGVLKKSELHPGKLRYMKPGTSHTYTPDFMIEMDGGLIYIESKARFRDMAEANKYIYIRHSLNIFDELVFLFLKPDLPMPNAKVRKDGSKRSHADWAEANNFRWFTEKTITQAWLD